MSDPNYQFFLWLLSRCPNAAAMRVLDFGCGRGEIVQLLRDAGMECVGVEVQDSGVPPGWLRDNALVRQGLIRLVPETGTLPFHDQQFDVVISNQVFEHVRDLPGTLAELKRVLKDDGWMYHHFPSREVIREGHIGIPCVHWFRPGSLRFAYTVVLRALGFGKFTTGESILDWARNKLAWLDANCAYRPYGEILQEFSREFTVRHQEITYCRVRAAHSQVLTYLLHIDCLRGVYEWLFRRLGFMALFMEKRHVKE
jgi:SAM-dependent methyltransferase